MWCWAGRLCWGLVLETTSQGTCAWQPGPGEGGGSGELACLREAAQGLGKGGQLPLAPRAEPRSWMADQSQGLSWKA